MGSRREHRKQLQNSTHLTRPSSVLVEDHIDVTSALMAAEALLKAIEHYAHHTRYKFFCVYLRRISDLFYTQKYMSPQEYSAWTNGFRSGQNAEEGSAQIACFEHMAEAAPESHACDGLNEAHKKGAHFKDFTA